MKKVRSFFINFVPYHSWRKGLRFLLCELGLSHYLNYLHYEYLNGEQFKDIREGKKGKPTSFENVLSAVAICKNEAPYLQEWLEYHLLVGIEKFYIYNNESSDNTREVLDPYIKEGIVVYEEFPGASLQCYSYSKTIRERRNKTKWLAIIDLDEFIVPTGNEDIKDFLKDFDGYSQIIVGWKVYGSDGHKNKPQGLVIENFKSCSAPDYITNSKVIVNPRYVRAVMNPHWCFVNGVSVDENKKLFEAYPYTTYYLTPISKNKICINHYHNKSWEEYLQKCAKGCADKNTLIRGKDLFEYYDKNEVFDPVMDKYITAVKAAIKKRNEK